MSAETGNREEAGGPDFTSYADLGIAEPNYDEAAIGDIVLPPLAMPDGTPVREVASRSVCQRYWVERFAREIYGPIPDVPVAIAVTRTPLPDANCERLTITLGVDGRRFVVEAALWLPPDRAGPVPLIVGLDFLGPIGNLYSEVFPIDPAARVAAPDAAGLEDGHLGDTARGVTAYRWPTPLILKAGWGLLLSCYGSWVPDDAREWRRHGVVPLVGGDSAPPTGAISLWAWALSRLIDVGVTLPEIDPRRIAVAGHSRLGKTALWAAANDSRVTDVYLNASGCLGASLTARNLGERPAHMRARFPHWLLREDISEGATDGLDQHQLLATIAPRRLYIATAIDDLWGDPRGEYLAMKAASPFWRIDGEIEDLPPVESVWHADGSWRSGALGWHVRPGGHEMLPHDWRHFLGQTP